MNKYKKYSATFIIILSAILGFTAYAEDTTTGNSDPVACTMDAKQCPDGSYVGRTGPNCEFAPCPGLSGSNTYPNLGGIRKEIRVNAKNTVQENKNIRKDFRQGVAENKQEIKNIRQEGKGDLMEDREEIKKIREENRLEYKGKVESIQANRQVFKEELSVKREEIKVRREEMKANFKESLAKVKDENKKIAAEKVVDGLATLNTKVTGNFSNTIDQIENVLIKIESRIAKAESNGLDVSSAKAESEKSRTAISQARQVVLAQTTKTYTVNVTSESALRAEMKKMRDLFNTDIKTVREQIKIAHGTVRATATTLAQIPRINEIEMNDTVESNDNNSDTN